MVIWRKKRKLKHDPNRTVTLSEFKMLLLEKNEKYAFTVPLTPATVQTYAVNRMFPCKGGDIS